MADKPVDRTIKRCRVRYLAARLLRAGERYLAWMVMRGRFARERMTSVMPHVHFRHETLLLRQLKDVDMKWQLNKVQNLKIASRKVDGVVERPGQPFSYWKLVRRPTYKKVTSTV